MAYCRVKQNSFSITDGLLSCSWWKCVENITCVWTLISEIKKLCQVLVFLVPHWSSWPLNPLLPSPSPHFILSHPVGTFCSNHPTCGLVANLRWFLQIVFILVFAVVVRKRYKFETWSTQKLFDTYSWQKSKEFHGKDYQEIWLLNCSKVQGNYEKLLFYGRYCIFTFQWNRNRFVQSISGVVVLKVHRIWTYSGFWQIKVSY